jgi:hypothetical protein
MSGGKTPPTLRFLEIGGDPMPAALRPTSGSKLRMTPARPNARKRQGGAKVFIGTSDRDERSLIAKHQLRDPCRHDANATRAGVI